MISNFEPFVYLLAIRVSSLEKCLLRSFAHFKIRLFVFILLSCMCSLYILDFNPLLDIWFASIFSHSVDSFFTLLIISFDGQKLFIFTFVSSTFHIQKKKKIAKTNAKKLFRILCVQASLMVFKSLIHFNFLCGII